jgi:hypothetical protein
MKATNLLVALVLLLSQVCFLAGQPKLVVSKPSSYVAGEFVEPGVQVLDRDMRPIALLDTLGSGTGVGVVVLFGGAAKKVPDEPFRGPLWCEDSFDDLGVQRALVRYFSGLPVEFIPVAIPPVYSTVRYGFEADVFLSPSVETDQFRLAVESFIRATEHERESTLLPFDKIYYDPRADLLRKPGGKDDGSVARVGQGRWKWHLDPRKYGTPTIWIISNEGEILREPFLGNDYDSEPPEINYGFNELREAIEDALQSVQSPAVK